MAQSTVEVLRAARKLIEDPERWTTKYYARGKSGRDVQPFGDAACRWCAVGAVAKVLGVPASTVEEGADAYRFLDDAVGDHADDIYDANDECGHGVTLDIYDRAIELAEAD